MPTVYGPLDIVKNEIRNAVMQNLGTAPAAPVKGLMYFNSADNTFYWYDGTQWVAAKGGAGAVASDTVTTQAFGDAPVAGVSTLYTRGDHKHGFPAHDAAAHSTIPVSAHAAATANVSMGGFLITNLGAPVAGTDAVTKQYVDGLISGLAWKDNVRVASTANVTKSGLIAVDGITVIANDRVLLKNQTAPAENGVWSASSGGWTRVTDMDFNTEFPNAAVFVSEGTVNKDTAWVCTTDNPITVDTTAITWVQFAGGGTVTAGNGLTQTGNTLDVGAGTGITVAADTVAVDTTVIASKSYVDTTFTKKYAAALTGTTSPETVTHNLNTRDVHVQVYNGATPYTSVEVDWDAATVNTLTVRYNPNLGAGYRIVVIG
jgi:hypothetical protein